jgi:hypothetical protein
MKRFAYEVMNTTVKNDNQIFPGVHEEVYRKVRMFCLFVNISRSCLHFQTTFHIKVPKLAGSYSHDALQQWIVVARAHGRVRDDRRRLETL